MDTSLKVLIVAGTAVLAYAFALGVPMALARQKAPVAPRHLVNAHMEGLIGGGILLALTAAVSFADLPSGLATTAAVLVSAGVVSALAGGTLNWRQGIDDPFAARSPGFMLQSAAGPLNLVGIAIILIGVLAAL